jgi:CCR4-NOT transcriptional complex subunit CAF120
MKNTVPDFSAHLSAREQEHVARVTGSPLINMAGNSAQSVPSGGLIGAIEAREREKEEMKAGVRSSVMVQQAIAQRQQQVQREQKAHQRTQSQQQQYQQQPMPYMHVPGQYPTTPQAYDEGRGNPQQDYMQAHRIMPPQQWPYQPPTGYQQQAQVAQYGATAHAQQQGQYQQYPHLPPQQQQQQGQFQQYPPPQQQQGQFQQYPSPSQQPQGQFSNQYYNSQYGSGSGQQGGR